MLQKQRRCAVTAQLICVFDFPYAKDCFSRDAAHLALLKVSEIISCIHAEVDSIVQRFFLLLNMSHKYRE